MHRATKWFIQIHFIMLVSKERIYHMLCVIGIQLYSTDWDKLKKDRCRNFGRKPVCEIFNAYDLECNRANILGLKWRPETNCHKGATSKKCQKRTQIFNLVCPAPFIWSDCGKPCDETCDDPAPACFGKCVPGCRCAAGYVFHDGDCIKPERCPSYVKPEKKKNPFKCIDWWNKIVYGLFLYFLNYICLLFMEDVPNDVIMTL